MLSTRKNYKVGRSEICGRRKKDQSLLEAVFRAASASRVGLVNYSEKGQKDGLGLEPVTSPFFDSFLLFVVVPDYRVNENGRYTQIGAVNSTIRAICRDSGLKIAVKAVDFRPLDSWCETKFVEKAPYRDTTQETGETMFYQQIYKVSCCKEERSRVTEFLRQKVFESFGIFIHDLDFTQDFAGIFNKEETIEFLTSKKGFRMQGEDFQSKRTILDNDKFVGRNCLTYMETSNKIKIRCKMYNKLAQSLESKSVRSHLGSHLASWAGQEGTRLADARDNSSERGMTRAEITFYTPTLPSDETLFAELDRFIKLIEPSLIFGCSFENQWRSFCTALKNSVVVELPQKDCALVGNYYNQFTQKIGGDMVQKWANKRQWCLANLTLGADLPIDICTVTQHERPIIVSEKAEKTSDIDVNIDVKRFYKSRENGVRSNFAMRLVKPGNVFYWRKEKFEGENVSMTQRAGLVQTPQCTPFLAVKASNVKSSVDLVLHEQEKVPVLEFTPAGKGNKAELDAALHIVACENAAGSVAYKIRQLEEVEESCRQKREQLKALEEFGNSFRSAQQCIKLSDLEVGSHEIFALKPVRDHFNPDENTYIFFLRIAGNIHFCYSNWAIKSTIREKLSPHMPIHGGYHTLFNKAIAKLTIYGHRYSAQRNKVVKCSFTLVEEAEADESEKERKEKMGQIKSEIKDKQIAALEKKESFESIPTLEMDKMPPYKNMVCLTELPKGVPYPIEGVAMVPHHGRDRLVIQLEGVVYKAGESLEDQEKNGEVTAVGTKVVLGKTRRTACKRKEYVVCEIIHPNAWTEVDYKSLPYISDVVGRQLKIMETAEKFVGCGKKVTKRSIYLVSDSNVYRQAKKGKLMPIGEII